MKIAPRAEMAPKMIKKRQSTDHSETRVAEGAKSHFWTKKWQKVQKSDFWANKSFWSKKVILERKSDFWIKSAEKWKWVMFALKWSRNDSLEHVLRHGANFMKICENFVNFITFHLLHENQLFMQIILLRFLRFLDFWGPGGAPGGARKGAPRGPPRELWVVRKSGKPLPPAVTPVRFNAPVINKRGPRGGPGRAPFFRQAALSVFVIFLI